MRSIVILAILGYRLIPVSVRVIWSSDSMSASESALRSLRSGEPIGRTLASKCIPRFTSIWEPPSWNN